MENEKVKILVVEDDPNLGTILSEYLKAKGFENTLRTNGEEGFEEFKENRYGLIILDIMMPKKDGLTLAKEIRQIDEYVPLIFLTAKSMKEDAIAGFEVGADDYITKPFSMEELLMRIKAILRRSANAPLRKQKYEIGKFTFQPREQLLESGDEKHKLTLRETELLQLFCENENQIVSRSHALNEIWKDDSFFNARSMDVYIARLRKFLKSDPNVEIVNVRGQGFRMDVEG